VFFSFFASLGKNFSALDVSLDFLFCDSSLFLVVSRLKTSKEDEAEEDWSLTLARLLTLVTP
jgi:hypothetical protein